MLTQDFDYNLRPGLIAQTPLEPRDSSRLLVLHRSSGRLEHRGFCDIVEYLNSGDLLVFNDTRVFPARLRGHRSSGGRVELLLLKRREACAWEALVKPGRLRAGETIVLGESGAAGGCRAEIGERLDGGARLVRLPGDQALRSVGEVPLPPYIRAPLDDRERYQTVYARQEGSAAAPTAGLHFTPRLLEELAGKGIRLAFVTLHIGLDTFRPVQVEDARQHHIHTEWGEIGAEAASLIDDARASGGRIVCVGTTSVRLLEAVAAANDGQVRAYCGNVDLFILPGHRFKVADAMVTNFHLPRTTLLMLVSAFAGRDLVLHAYRDAMERGYRFYSFGDAMLIA